MKVSFFLRPLLGFPGGSEECRRPGFDPWVRKIPWRRKWQPTPVLLPGKFHGWRSLAGSVHAVAKSQTQLCNFTFTFLSLKLKLKYGLGPYQNNTLGVGGEG